MQNSVVVAINILMLLFKSCSIPNILYMLFVSLIISKVLMSYCHKYDLTILIFETDRYSLKYIYNVSFQVLVSSVSIESLLKMVLMN